MSLPEGISLTLDADGEVGHFIDSRGGFQLLIPGRPTMHAFTPSGVEPLCEVQIELAALPITLALRLSILPEDAADSVQPLALAQAISQVRAQTPPRPHAAQPSQRQHWGAEAAASVLYPLQTPNRNGADTEEVLVLLHCGKIVTLFISFPAKQLAPLDFHLWSSALLGGLRFSAAAAPPDPLWPQSTFLLPGLFAGLHDDNVGRLQRLQPLAAVAHAEEGTRRSLRAGVEKLLAAKDPPTQVIAPTERRALFEMLRADLLDDAAAQALGEVFAEVQTAHDLRGLALLLLHVLGAPPARFPLPALTSPFSFLV